MFRTNKVAIALGAFLATVSLSVSAHFLVMYTPNSALNRPSDVPIHLVFTHVFDGGPSVTMDKPEKFYHIYRQGRFGAGEEVDLTEYLEPISWLNGDERIGAWKANLPRKVMRSMGDYQIVVEPTPFYAEQEDIYIQQFSKMMVNVGGVPGNWASTLGLPAEIEALNKPYANWTGGIFRGIVLSGGLPVPFTQVEVEYLNHPLNLKKNRFAKKGLIDPPHPAFGRMVILTNELGEFSFVMPKAGWWGFAALGVGPEKTHKGKSLSQDAILWVQATDLPK